MVQDNGHLLDKVQESRTLKMDVKTKGSSSQTLPSQAAPSDSKIPSLLS